MSRSPTKSAVLERDPFCPRRRARSRLYLDSPISLRFAQTSRSPQSDQCDRSTIQHGRPSRASAGVISSASSYTSRASQGSAAPSCQMSRWKRLKSAISAGKCSIRRALIRNSSIKQKPASIAGLAARQPVSSRQSISAGAAKMIAGRGLPVRLEPPHACAIRGDRAEANVQPVQRHEGTTGPRAKRALPSVAASRPGIRRRPSRHSFAASPVPPAKAAPGQ